MKVSIIIPFRNEELLIKKIIDQLENELEENAWLVRQNTYSNKLDINTEELWKNNLLSFGRKYTIWANAPSDPKLN